MRPSDDPLFLTPEQRFQQIASLLARGLLRLPLTLPGENSFPEKSSGIWPRWP